MGQQRPDVPLVGIHFGPGPDAVAAPFDEQGRYAAQGGGVVGSCRGRRKDAHVHIQDLGGLSCPVRDPLFGHAGDEDEGVHAFVQITAVHVHIKIGIILQAGDEIGQTFGLAAVIPARKDPVQVLAVFRHDLGQPFAEPRSVGQVDDGQPSGHDVLVQF